jgi:hypothetical protein
VHAVIIPATFNDRSAAEKELAGLVAQISSMPGFVTGYWVATAQDRGTALVVFDTEESAGALVTLAQGGHSAAVTAGNIEIGKVLAHA